MIHESTANLGLLVVLVICLPVGFYCGWCAAYEYLTQRKGTHELH